MIPEWRAAGCFVEPYFLSLPSPEAAVARVASRVARGGHDVPEPTIRRRFAAGRRNFDDIYRALADSWKLHDNSGGSPILLAEGANP